MYSWLKEAERVARNNDWSDVQKLRFFQDRLKGESMDWHLDFIQNNPIADYNEWRTAFVQRFLDQTDIEKIRNKLLMLRQKNRSENKSICRKN